MPDPSAFRPGFVVLHGNRLEDLAALSLDWLARHPLGPLDEETLLVPSSGMAEWLKGAMAQRDGIAAGFRIELPAQFMWRAWRAVLGPAAVPMQSPLDKGPLTWWLMRLLPQLAQTQGARLEFAPLAAFLAADGEAVRSADGTAPGAVPGAADAGVMRRLELAHRLADLFDQYQVYRPDWLDDWAAGRDQLRRGADGAEAIALPPGQRWQPALWRALLGELATRPAAAAPTESRPVLHRRFIHTLDARPAGTPPPGLPPRLLLFGTTHLPHTTLEALVALARHIPVLLAVPDPSSHPWAQLGSNESIGHPLLQAWGRQSRDFVRQLQTHDQSRERAEKLGLVRTALFDETPAVTLLQQLQARMRELTPAHEKALALNPDDRSLVFHEAHGPMREVELLHDQLLEAFACGEFEPRDVVVMVPDIEVFAPAIAAVFGRFAPGHPRHIAWGLADRRERGRHPLLRTLEALLQVRERRWGLSELRDWLATPAVATRWGLSEADVDTLCGWMAGAGARWGLHQAQRAALGLQAAGAVGTWRFALDRLLMGYATGALPPEAEPAGGIDPWPEVAGLEAALAGTLAQALQQLDACWAAAAVPRPPAHWLPELRGWLTAMFSARDGDEGGRDRTLLAMLDQALQDWVAACEAAGFAEPVALDLVREAWLQGIDEAGGGRFRAGGVTFCTLLPLRAIPFRCVCLLGMNDGDYPRPSSRSDFDLMAEPALARPGDRSRRDDDRQLMLDALLAARDRLHISWSAHSARDATPRPPSVLVQQLRDHVQALWGDDALTARTLSHPLQPFSRRYIEAGTDERLFTYADEWRGLHEAPAAVAAGPAAIAPPAPSAPSPSSPPRMPTLRQLADFLRSPVAAWFRERLHTDLRLRDDEVDDDEPFVDGGLSGWQWRDELLRTLQDDPATAAPRLAGAVERLQREGRLPWGGPGDAAGAALRAQMQPVLQAWTGLRATHTSPDALEPVSVALDGQLFEAGLLPWTLDPGGQAQLLQLSASQLASGKTPKAPTKLTKPTKPTKPKPRADKLLAGWLQQLALGASGRPAGLWALGVDVIVRAAPIPAELARSQLTALVAAWQEGIGAGSEDSSPWPTVLATALETLRDGGKPRQAFESGLQHRGDDQDPHLARLFPGFDALVADPRFLPLSQRLYTPLWQWLEQLQVSALPDAVALADDGDNDGEAHDE